MHNVFAGFLLVLVVCGTSADARAQKTNDKSPSQAAAGRGLRIGGDEDAISIERIGGQKVLQYVLRQPTGSKLSVASAGYIHPLATPKGVTVTDVAPDDHRHHRGVFLAFVEMHGKQDGDFWGWGEHAPKDGRVIKHVAHKIVAGKSSGPWGFEIHNQWLAGGESMIEEQLDLKPAWHDAANVVYLRYSLTPTSDTRLPRWAFSGFCVRLRKDGEVVYTSPEGVVERPALDHLKPELNWPAADWYDATVKLADGGQAGVTVVDHPGNPRSTWHNETRIRMINPCIVAPGEVALKQGQPLTLRYCLIVHDGPAPIEAVREIAKDFRASK
jgi:hypothetical protein